MNKILLILLSFVFSTIGLGQNLSPRPLIKSSSGLPNMRDFTMSKNGKEAYATVVSPLEDIAVIVRLKKTRTKWKLIEILSFSGIYNDLEPFLSPDNLRLYFASNRPSVGDSVENADFDIWFVERKTVESTWGIPVNIGPDINTTFNEFYPSVSTNNNLYFTSDRPSSKGKDDIFFSEFKQGHYLPPVSLSDSVNSIGYEFNSYVSPDESYLLFTAYNRSDGLGSGDLYVSYKTKDGSWTKAQHLGTTVNSAAMDYCPFVDQTTGTLYFTSKRSSYEQATHFTTVEDLLEALSKSENGMSRVYSIQLNDALLQNEDIQSVPKRTKN